MEMTMHAIKRVKQRGIPNFILDALYQFGVIEYHQGREIYSIDRRILKTIKHDAGYLIRNLEKLAEIYMVMDNNKVITVAHKTQRMKQKRH